MALQFQCAPSERLVCARLLPVCDNEDILIKLLTLSTDSVTKFLVAKIEP